MSDYVVKDSGERIDFATGSKRDTNAGKPRFDLISVFGMRELAEHMAKGAEKYGERNWELGQNTSRSYESALRHLAMWQYDDSENHLAAAVFNIFSIIHVKTLIDMGKLEKSLDDATRFLPEEPNPKWFEPTELDQVTYSEFNKAFNLAPRLDMLMAQTAAVIGAAENEAVKVKALSMMTVDDMKKELERRGIELEPKKPYYPRDPREPNE